MKHKILLAFSFWMAVLLISCNKDDISFDAPSQELRFSADTVFCDTVYHQVRSETYAVKVYNNEDKDVMIPSIKLEKGAASLYRINVEGTPGYDFKNVPLRKKDSLYIFVEIAPTATGPEAIAEDKVLFNTSIGQQHVTLFSVVQDAEFFIETPTNPNVITSNTTWNNDKAKIIYGDLTIEGSGSLNINPGTKVYFHKNSGMKVKTGGSLNITGSLGNEVILRGDRNDTKYDTLPKNWNSIKMEQGTTLNMDYAKLYGGTKGLDLKQTNASIKNSIIHNFFEYGIYSVNSTINAQNLVMNNCGDAAIGIFKGGNYKFTHSTIANYSSVLSASNRTCIFAGNEWKNENGVNEYGALQFEFLNSIAYSDRDNAIYLIRTSTQLFNYNITNCLIKYSNQLQAEYDFSTTISSLKNVDPKFMNYFAAQQNLRVKADSPAKNSANVTIAATVPTDIAGVSRTSNPTIGAYQ